MKLSALEKNFPLFLTLFLTVILRLPSLLEPFWYGDEGVYMTVGQGLLHGLPLYTGVFDNKPPGIYLLSAFSTLVFGHSIWSLRFVLLLWVLSTQVIIFLLAKKLFKSTRAALFAAVIFSLLTSTPLLEGNIANGEIFFILFTSLGFLMGWKEQYFWAGVSFAFAVLFKAPAVFDFLAFGMLLLIHSKGDSIVTVVKRIILTGMGFLLPLLLTVIYFTLRGHFHDFYFAVLGSNVTYTDYGNHFIIPNGLLYLKALGLGLVLILFLLNIIKSWRKGVVIKPENLVISSLILWLFFALYGSLFGGRNYPHYLMQIVPPFTLLLTSILTRTQVHQASLALLVSLIIAALFGFYPQYWRWNYYPNAFNYLVGRMSQSDFNNSFDKKVNRNYTLAMVVKKLTVKDDQIYVWANDSQLYFLTERVNTHRYIASYHTNNYHAYTDTMKKLNSRWPRIIIIEQPLPYPFPELTTFVHSYYSLAGEFDGAQIYRLKLAF